MKSKRYSNYVTDDIVVQSATSSTGSGLLANGGWTPQNTVDVVNTGASALTTILTAIFGRNNIQQANYSNELYKQEQRTNTILWVVLGLVLALGVVLVIRKTK